MPLSLIVNGQSRSFEALNSDSTVSELVEGLGMKPDRVAIERNGDIAPRSGWPTLRLADGDKLEIVHFVGGGAASGRR